MAFAIAAILLLLFVVAISVASWMIYGTLKHKDKENRAMIVSVNGKGDDSASDNAISAPEGGEATLRANPPLSSHEEKKPPKSNEKSTRQKHAAEADPEISNAIVQAEKGDDEPDSILRNVKTWKAGKPAFGKKGPLSVLVAANGKFQRYDTGIAEKKSGMGGVSYSLTDNNPIPADKSSVVLWIWDGTAYFEWKGESKREKWFAKSGTVNLPEKFFGEDAGSVLGLIGKYGKKIEYGFYAGENQGVISLGKETITKDEICGILSANIASELQKEREKLGSLEKNIQKQNVFSNELFQIRSNLDEIEKIDFGKLKDRKKEKDAAIERASKDIEKLKQRLEKAVNDCGIEGKVSWPHAGAPSPENRIKIDCEKLGGLVSKYSTEAKNKFVELHGIKKNAEGRINDLEKKMPNMPEYFFTPKSISIKDGHNEKHGASVAD